MLPHVGLGLDAGAIPACTLRPDPIQRNIPAPMTRSNSDPSVYPCGARSRVHVAVARFRPLYRLRTVPPCTSAGLAASPPAINTGEQGFVTARTPVTTEYGQILTLLQISPRALEVAAGYCLLRGCVFHPPARSVPPYPYAGAAEKRLSKPCFATPLLKPLLFRCNDD